jgi:hypothetical protein
VARGVPLEDKAAVAAPGPLKQGQPGSDENGFILLDDDLVGFELAAEEAAERKGASEPDVTDFALELNLSEGQNEPPVAAKEAEEIVSLDDLAEVLKVEDLELIPEKEVVSREKALEEIVSLSDLEDDAAQMESDLLNMDDLLKGAGPVKASASFKESEGKPEPRALDEVREPLPAAAPTLNAGPVVTGISEEKLEAIVTKVVQDVLERTARETMASVAERVISEAIESLKKSLSENP